jgi:transposase-like protein
MADWTDEKKARAVELYKEGNPTPENSMEIVKEVAEELEESPNGVRMILTRAGVYVTKTGGATASSTKKKDGDKPASTRVSKEDAHAQLTKAIEDAGHTVDTDIVGKLTGKAALYFAPLIK